MKRNGFTIPLHTFGRVKTKTWRRDLLSRELPPKCIIKYKLAGKQKSFSLLGIKSVWLQRKLFGFQLEARPKNHLMLGITYTPRCCGHGNAAAG